MYDVSDDGERFIMSREDPGNRRRFHIVLDATAAIERARQTFAHAR